MVMARGTDFSSQGKLRPTKGEPVPKGIDSIVHIEPIFVI